MKVKYTKKISGLSGLLGIAMASGVILGATPAADAAAPAATAASAAKAPSWHVTRSVTEKSDFLGAVAATGKSSGWVFQDAINDEKPTVYELSGSGLKAVSFPGVADEVFDAAAATSASNVWAFGYLPNGKSDVVRLVRGKWTVVKTLDGSVDDVSVLAANDVWVFGWDGVYHYNGSTWTRVASLPPVAGGGTGGGAALSSNDAWLYGGTSVIHLQGGKKKVYDLQDLLPAKAPDPGVYGIFPETDRSVYAIGAGGDQDSGGPVVILHYNGSTWSKVADYPEGNLEQPASDGKGGFWLAATAGAYPSMLHFSDGKLTKLALPEGPTLRNTDFGEIYVTEVSPVPGTTDELAVGNMYGGTLAAPKLYGEVLSYS
jgi:hypothetical protein